MTILADFQIEIASRKGMIQPFIENSVTFETDLGGYRRVISYGLSSYGYDARLSEEFMLFEPSYGVIMDPKNPSKAAFKEIQAKELLLPPHSYVLGRTIETFDIPPDVLAICVGKSTYARAGIMINVTPLEPGWRGEVTLEIANLTQVPVKLYANEGICQFVFHRSEWTCARNYGTKSSAKYQDQKGITLGRV